MINTIIISRTDKIGDLILSIPSLFMLHKMYPKAKLIVLVRTYNYEIVKNLPYINEVIKIDDFEQSILWQKIKNYHADVFIALYHTSFIAKLARISKAPIKIGPWSKISSYLSYNKGVRQNRSQSLKNEAQYNLDLVRKLNPELFSKHYQVNNKIYYEEKYRQNANLFLIEHQITHPILLINPFMGGSAKNITDKQYQELMRLILSLCPNINIIVTIHCSEQERGIQLIKDLPLQSVHLFINHDALLNLVALIDLADVYLGGSTGPTHIAGSLNKKIVAIYPNKKTQHPTRWGVIGSQQVTYIIPDLNNVNENYNHKFFDTYDEHTAKALVQSIVALL